MLWTGKRGKFCSILCEFLIDNKLILMWDFVVEIEAFPTNGQFSFENRHWYRIKILLGREFQIETPL